MEETENKDVKEQEIIEPEKDQSSESQPETQENSQNLDVGTKEYNWRKMEEKHKKEMEELRKELWALQQKEQEKSAPKEEDINLAPDDLITYSQLDKLAEKKARSIFQEEIKKAEKAKQPFAVREKYPDFDKIVTSENIEKLKQEDPELEQLIMMSSNPFERTYKEIKKSNFFASYQVDRETSEKIAENSKKPVSSNVAGKQRPLSYANDYAKGDPNLWKEVSKYRGGSL